MFEGGSTILLDGARSLKVTNDPQFAEYARENYIIDDDEICNDD
jgi:hypothetical protein